MANAGINPAMLLLNSLEMVVALVADVLDKCFFLGTSFSWVCCWCCGEAGFADDDNKAVTGSMLLRGTLVRIRNVRSILLVVGNRLVVVIWLYYCSKLVVVGPVSCCCCCCRCRAGKSPS